jgi:chromosome segregation ATPase
MMIMLNSLLRSLAFLALALLPTFTSCASTKGHERADNLATSMEQLETALAKAKTDLAATRTALSAVDEKASVDPKPSYDQLVASVKALNASTARVTDTATKIKERGNAYLTNWERRSDAIADADIKAADTKRREKLAGALKEVVESVAAVDKEVGPLVALLADLRTALDNDLTPAGIDAMEGPMGRASKAAGRAIDAIDDASETLADVKVQFQTAKPPAEPAAKPAAK